MISIPDFGKADLTGIIRKALREYLDDPVVEITEPSPNTIMVRVASDPPARGPRYFKIRISESA